MPSSIVARVAAALGMLTLWSNLYLAKIPSRRAAGQQRAVAKKLPSIEAYCTNCKGTREIRHGRCLRCRHKVTPAPPAGRSE
jgi:uncharacterized paraquat-inducible protein A